MKFNIYIPKEAKSHYTRLSRIVIVLLLIGFSFSLISMYDESFVYVVIPFFVIAIIIKYYLIYDKYNNPHILRTGIVEFEKNSISIKTSSDLIVIPKDEILEISFDYSSYKGRSNPVYYFMSTESDDGLGNSMSLKTNDLENCYNLEISNRGQLLSLRKILAQWKNENINVLVVDNSNR